MHKLLRSIGIGLFLFGIGSFVMPLFNRDHAIWMAFGGVRKPAMIVAILLGAGLAALSYKLQLDHEREQAARRRAAREKLTRQPQAEAVEDSEPEYDGPDSYADEPASSEAYEPRPALENPLDFPMPVAAEVAAERPAIRGGSSVLVVASSATPEVVAEYNPVAQEKAGSESVVIEKRDEERLKRPQEKSPSALQPMAEKKLRAAPAFEEDPESIFDELPQTPPQSLK